MFAGTNDKVTFIETLIHTNSNSEQALEKVICMRVNLKSYFLVFPHDFVLSVFLVAGL